MIGTCSFLEPHVKETAGDRLQATVSSVLAKFILLASRTRMRIGV